MEKILYKYFRGFIETCPNWYCCECLWLWVRLYQCQKWPLIWKSRGVIGACPSWTWDQVLYTLDRKSFSYKAYIEKHQLRLANLEPNMLVSAQKLEYPERNHAGTGSTSKLWWMKPRVGDGANPCTTVHAELQAEDASKMSQQFKCSLEPVWCQNKWMRYSDSVWCQ